jgi:hypothetical protein
MRCTGRKSVIQRQKDSFFPADLTFMSRTQERDSEDWVTAIQSLHAVWRKWAYPLSEHEGVVLSFASAVEEMQTRTHDATCPTFHQLQNSRSMTHMIRDLVWGEMQTRTHDAICPTFHQLQNSCSMTHMICDLVWGGNANTYSWRDMPNVPSAAEQSLYDAHVTWSGVGGNANTYSCRDMPNVPSAAEQSLYDAHVTWSGVGGKCKQYSWRDILNVPSAVEE